MWLLFVEKCASLTLTLKMQAVLDWGNIPLHLGSELNFLRGNTYHARMVILKTKSELVSSYLYYEFILSAGV